MFPAEVEPRPPGASDSPAAPAPALDPCFEVLFRSLLDSAAERMLATDEAGRIHFANQAAAADLGYTGAPKDLEGKLIQDLLSDPPDWNSGQSVLTFRTADGEPGACSYVVSIRRIEAGPARVFRVLSWTNPPFPAGMPEQSPFLEAVLALRPGYPVLYINPAGAALLGYASPRDVLGRSFASEFAAGPPFNLPETGSCNREWILRNHASGKFTPIELHCSRDSGATWVRVYARDVGECRRLGIEAHMAVERLHQLIDLAPVEMVMYDHEMRFLAISARTRETYGLKEDVRGRSVYEVFPEIPQHWRDIHQRCLAGATESHPGEWFPRADGTRRLVKWLMRPWYRHDLSIGGVVIFSEDITETWRANQLLADSEARYRSLVDQATDALFLHDVNGRFIDVNPMATQLMGYSREELLEMSVFDLEKGLRPQQIRDLWESIIPGQPVTVAGCLTRKDGVPVRVEVRLGVCILDGESLFLAQTRDITDRLRAQEKLRALTAQVLTAHEEERRRIALELHDDFTQRLGVIGIELGFLRKDPNTPAEITGKLESTRAAIIALTEQMRELSHQFHPGILDHAGLRAAVEAHCHDVARLSGIAVTCSARSVPDAIPGDIALALYRILQEALRNVVRHAAADAAHVFLTGLENPPRLVLSIVDHGCGFMIEEVRDGAGLGLLSIEERTRLLQGVMRLSSVPGEGTRLEIEIPLPGREMT